jgi:hypothetical protein
MDKTHFEEGIWSYNFFNTGAILLVTVPATIIMSACRGLALNIIPSLSISYLLTATCIISIAQQAKPKVKGHKEPPFAQFNNFLNFNFIQSNNIFKLLYNIPDNIIIIIANAGNIALKATLSN